MARKIPENIALDDAEEEVLFTQAALAADPDAAEFAELTKLWLEPIDALRLQERETRRKIAHTEAARIVTNSRLDLACTRFGDELFLNVNKDRESARWRQFFSVAVSRFVRIALSRQVETVRAWLSSNDETLLKHKEALGLWAARADEALVNTRRLAVERGELSIARAEFAENFTKERDGLHAALGARARELRLGRTWPNTFFRVAASTTTSSEDDEAATDTEPVKPTT
jgi:hypothetical protein